MWLWLATCALLLQCSLCEDNLTGRVHRRSVPSVKGPAHLMSRFKRSPGPPLTEITPFLTWVEWSGSLPSWAVGFYIPYTERIDYVCTANSGCRWSIGYYNPSVSSCCQISCHQQEYENCDFYVLVNKDNFEVLEWKSYVFSLQDMIVKTNDDIFAGRNKYGLGNIFEDEFHLPWKGSDYKYKLRDGFDVLTVRREKYVQKVFDVRYNVNEMSIVLEPPSSKAQHVVENLNCKPIQLTAQLNKSTEKQSTWELSGGLSLTLSSSFTVKVPLFGQASAGLDFSAEITVTNSNSVTETTGRSVSVTLEVPPNHSFLVEMTGRKEKVDIPFTASIIREFHEGSRRTSSVTGIYKGVDVVEVHTVVRRCEPIPIAKSCLVPL